MVSCTKFKPEVFSSLLISLIGLTLFMASIITNEWVTGEATPSDSEEPGSIKVNYGLFSGSKEENRFGYVISQLSVVCSDGFCMFSCGGKSDLQDILADIQTADTSDGDQLFCDEEKINNNVEFLDKTSVDTSASKYTKSNGRYDKLLLRATMYNTTLAFLCIGLFFAVVNLIFTVINIAHNPISSIFGVDGLVIWNVGVVLSYLLVLILWGAEFTSRLSKNLCISETLRNGGIQWTSEDQASLGYSFWLLIPNMFLHIVNAGILGYRQYKRYYSTASKQSKNLQMKVQETAEGKDMLY